MSGGKGSKSVTVGYRYYAGMHLALCHGPVDSLNKIVVGERTAWSGSSSRLASVSAGPRGTGWAAPRP